MMEKQWQRGRKKMDFDSMGKLRAEAAKKSALREMRKMPFGKVIYGRLLFQLKNSCFRTFQLFYNRKFSWKPYKCFQVKISKSNGQKKNCLTKRSKKTSLLDGYIFIVVKTSLKSRIQHTKKKTFHCKRKQLKKNCHMERREVTIIQYKCGQLIQKSFSFSRWN